MELCREVVLDPWGLNYNMVTRKLGLFKPLELLDAPTTVRVTFNTGVGFTHSCDVKTLLYALDAQITI